MQCSTNDDHYIPRFQPGINIKEDSFINIPNYSRYEINSLGHIRHKKRLSLMATTVSARGYLCATLLRDDGWRAPVKVHRLLALVFLEHPKDVDKLVVNHIDGNKSNNSLKNLEWVTSKRNARHAREIGLFSGIPCKAVEAMNIETKEILLFDSMAECAEFFHVQQSSVADPIYNHRGIRPYKGYYLKLRSDPRPWPEPDAVFQINKVIGVCAKNIETGEILKFKSMRDLGKFLGTSTSSIFYQVNSSKLRPYMGYLIREDKGDEIDWTVDGSVKNGKPVEVTEISTGKKTIYPAIGFVVTAIKISAETVSKMLRTGRKCRGYSVKFVEE